MQFSVYLLFEFVICYYEMCKIQYKCCCLPDTSCAALHAGVYNEWSKCIGIRSESPTTENLKIWYILYLGMSSKICKLYIEVLVEGSITIRRTAIPSMLVNFSTFAFLLNVSFIKYRKHQSFGYRGLICITNINNRDFYVCQGISL